MLNKSVFNKDKNNYYYKIIDVSEEIDINKTGTSKEFNICYYWYFLDNRFMFQPDVCDGCHNVLMMSITLLLF